MRSVKDVLLIFITIVAAVVVGVSALAVDFGLSKNQMIVILLSSVWLMLFIKANQRSLKYFK